jgi:hypothetical protein
MFGKSSKHEEAAPAPQGRKPSIKELEARALDTWTSPAYSSEPAKEHKEPRKGSFEAVRAAKEAAHGGDHGVVMRT